MEDLQVEMTDDTLTIEGPHGIRHFEGTEEGFVTERGYHLKRVNDELICTETGEGADMTSLYSNGTVAS